MSAPISNREPNLEAGSALAQAGVSMRRWDGSMLQLDELQGFTLARLICAGPTAELAAACTGSGVTLPLAVNGRGGRDPAALCLAPGEWLFSSTTLDFERLAGRLQPALAGRTCLLLDQSAAYGAFRITGAAAPWLLQKFCGLDLATAIAGGPHCSQTRLDQAAVILHYHEPDGGGRYVFDLLFERSLARYLWQALLFSAPHAEELLSRYGAPA